MKNVNHFYQTLFDSVEEFIDEMPEYDRQLCYQYFLAEEKKRMKEVATLKADHRYGSRYFRGKHGNVAAKYL